MSNTKQIKNGSLYFNKVKNQVQRVLGKINSQRVWTKVHDEKIKDVKVKDLRLANQEEVSSYLEDKSMPVGNIIRAAINSKGLRVGLPPLPSS